MKERMRALRLQPQCNNLFKFKRMRIRVEPENFLKSRLTSFILNNIMASITRDIGNLASLSHGVRPRVLNPNS